jgi:Minimal binding motif of Hap4 for binding to Hap2/3/5
MLEEKDKATAKMKIVRKQRKPKIWASRRSQSYQLAEYVHSPFPRRVPLRCLLSLHRRSYPLHLPCGQLVSTVCFSQFFFGLISYHFATLLASKEWVIPAKPKPGRKPKKDLAPAPVQQSDVIIYNSRFVLRTTLKWIESR